MRLILARHGETEENKAGILMGLSPGKLTVLGIEQAKNLANRLKSEKIDYIYSSDLARASDTAKEIIKFHPNTPFEFTLGLRERDMGDLEGKNKKDIGWDAIGGETLEELCLRAEKFLHQILLKHQNDIVLFVSHDVVNKAFIAVITNKKPQEIRYMKDQKNTGLIIFDIDENKNHKIVSFNDTRHLE